MHARCTLYSKARAGSGATSHARAHAAGSHSCVSRAKLQQRVSIEHRQASCELRSSAGSASRRLDIAREQPGLGKVPGGRHRGRGEQEERHLDEAPAAQAPLLDRRMIGVVITGVIGKLA